MALKADQSIKTCEKNIIASPKEIFASDAFQRCEKETLKRILHLDLICKEIEVFNACLKWAKYRCEQNDLDETQAKNLKLHLGDCLSLIRFGTMKSDEFTALAMKNDGLFTPEEFKDIIFTLTSADYEPKIFSRAPRRFAWNGKDILSCQRVCESEPTRYVQSSEIVWFTSNKAVLLGEIRSKATTGIQNDTLLKDADIHVTIAEIGNDSSKKILYENSSKNWEDDKGKKVLVVALNQPILIEPQILYEIRLTVPTTNSNSGGNSYYHATWKPMVEIKNGPTIQFLRNSRFETYDTSSVGWISCLSFNRI